MTTPTVENTVFIVAPETVKERCDIGKDIRRRRAEAVRVATIETWWKAEGDGWLEYTLHYAKCLQCQEFELTRRSERWAVIEQQEAK